MSTTEIFPISWGGLDKGGTGQRVLQYYKIFYYIGLSEGRGFYFELNSFHHRISLTKLEIWNDLIEGFIPFIETMKSIITHNGENDQSLLDTFLNIIVLINKVFNSHKYNVISDLKNYTINIST